MSLLVGTIAQLLSARRYDSAGTSYGPVSVSVWPVTLKMHDLKMTDKNYGVWKMQEWKMTDKLLANCEQNYGVWKMQDWKMTDKENYGSSRIRLIY